MPKISEEKMAVYLANGNDAVSSEISEQYVNSIFLELDNANIEYFDIPRDGSHLIAVDIKDQNAFLDIQKKVYSYNFNIDDKKNDIRTVYHGSDHIIKKPEYGKGNPDCDYGLGFYVTENPDKGAEWSLTTGKDSTAINNKYTIDLSQLNVVNLDDYGPLAWIAEIASNRILSSESAQFAAEIISDMYRIDTTNADVVIGYRADSGGKYMDILEAFLNGELTIDETEKLFKKGELGEQICLKSERAFDKIKFETGTDCSKTPIPDNRKAISDVSKFLQRRKEEINKGIKPQGLVIDDITLNKFTYDKNNKYYEIECKENGYES